MSSSKQALLELGTEIQAAPEVIEQVKSTRYSIARRYGRICAFGHQYVYRKNTDTLIRADIYQQQKQQPQPTHVNAASDSVKRSKRRQPLAGTLK